MKNKVDWIKGWGTLVNKNDVSVALESGKTQTLNAKNIIIATGSEPINFPGVEFDEEVIVSNTGALAAKSIPKKLVTIGGGIVGLEMGSVYARLGS
jgi:dihydrolipoamide dehydrogenase